jgi:hypothetical protein
MLSCDWLVGGSLVQLGTNTQIWIKVIDVQSGVVLDLKTFPLDPSNFTATLVSVPSFLAGINSQSEPRQFLALGRFEDQSLSSLRADWSQRLPALIEKHFGAAGYGIVEREATAPIFSEFQFESAGLTGDYTNRILLKPAFWLIDGGYKWVYDTQEKLSIALRIQKVGGGVQIFRFDTPVTNVEETVLNTIQSALTNISFANPEQARAAESAAETDTAMKYAAGHDEFANGSISTTRSDALNKLKQAILLDPSNMRAKYMLGMGLFETVDSEESRQGKEILNEVAASKDPKYATMAKNLLDDFATGRLTISPAPFGGQQITPHGQPLSWPSLSAPTPPMPAPAPVTGVITNFATNAETVTEIPPLQDSADFEWITAIKYYHGKVFVSCHNTRPFEASAVVLNCYDPVTQSTTQINLPPNVQHSILSIEADDNNLWLGTDGDGLVQLSRSGQLIRVFGENDGFPSASIQSVQLDNGRLSVDFGNNESGSIDLTTGKFTGAMSDIKMFKPGNDMEQPFAFPPASGTNSTYLAMTLLMGGVAVCPPHGTQWTCINLSTNFDLNVSYACMLDPGNPGLLWIGRNHGKVTLLDMARAQVVAECDIASDEAQEVHWIFDDPHKIIFVVDGSYAGQDSIYCLDKSLLSGKSAPAGNESRMAAIHAAPSPFDADWPQDFLRQNFSRFVTVQFKKGEHGEAALQRLPVHDNMFMYGSEIFFGFKFTVPAWCDGDFQWMYSVAKTEQNKYFASVGTDSGVMTQTNSEDDGDFDTMVEDNLNNYPRLHQLLPYSRSLQIQSIRQERLKPGQTYAIWFEVQEKDYPDFIFALTLNSKRGAEEYGILPLSNRQAAPEPVTTSDPPHSAEELRSRFEAALKAKDEAAALSLVYWHGADYPHGEFFPPGIFSKGDLYGEMDQCMAHSIGSVSLTGFDVGMSTTNETDGYRYRPNIPPVGQLEITSTDRKWVESLVYSKLGDAYYVPVGIQEPLSPNQ